MKGEEIWEELEKNCTNQQNEGIKPFYNVDGFAYYKAKALCNIGDQLERIANYLEPPTIKRIVAKKDL